MSDLKKNPKPRKIYLFDVVKEESVSPLIKDIIKFNDEDDEREREFSGFDRTEHPIEFYISSYGGYINCGLGLYDTIEMSKTPVHTIMTGKAMSMGLILMLAGKKRFAMKNSTAMYHEASYGAWGKLEEIKMEAKELERLQEEYLDPIVLSKTNITKEKLLEVRKVRGDWYINASESKKLGIVHEVI